MSDFPLLRNCPNTYLLSLFCVALGAFLATAVCDPAPWRWRILAAFVVLSHLPWRPAFNSRPGSSRVLLVQTTAPTTGQTSTDGATALAQAYRLTGNALRDDPKADLIVWPETTVVLNQRRDGGFTGLDWAILSKEGFGAPLLTGALVIDASGRRTNQAILIGPQGQVQTYTKRRLVPFGERAPFVEFLPWLARLAPEPALEPGTRAGLMAIPNREFDVRPVICFESCFPTAWNPTGHILQGWALGVVLTNDQWFAGTEAPRMHRAMGLLRAAENKIPVLQCANGGYSFLADGQGRILNQLPFGKPGVMWAELPSAPATAVAN